MVRENSNHVGDAVDDFALFLPNCSFGTRNPRFLRVSPTRRSFFIHSRTVGARAPSPAVSRENPIAPNTSHTAEAVAIAD